MLFPVVKKNGRLKPGVTGPTWCQSCLSFLLKTRSARSHVSVEHFNFTGPWCSRRHSIHIGQTMGMAGPKMNLQTNLTYDHVCNPFSTSVLGAAHHIVNSHNWQVAFKNTSLQIYLSLRKYKEFSHCNERTRPRHGLLHMNTHACPIPFDHACKIMLCPIPLSPNFLPKLLVKLSSTCCSVCQCQRHLVWFEFTLHLYSFFSHQDLKHKKEGRWISKLCQLVVWTRLKQMWSWERTHHWTETCNLNHHSRLLCNALHMMHHLLKQNVHMYKCIIMSTRYLYTDTL